MVGVAEAMWWGWSRSGNTAQLSWGLSLAIFIVYISSFSLYFYSFSLYFYHFIFCASELLFFSFYC